ncbi:MAG: radical SAM protein [Phycisphaerae bacterium]
MTTDRSGPVALFADHQRSWQENRYVYPVISRRSRGLSIGINLNPDGACNFDCVYCQVDRAALSSADPVDPSIVGLELDRAIASALAGDLFDHPRFADVPPAMRRLSDIAFSGDGEPTTCPQFAECVRVAAHVKARYRLNDVKLVLITDACYLTRPEVERGLAILAANQGEVWAKLDAGTESYFRQVNRPNVSLTELMDNITAAARNYPLCIQSMWMGIDGQDPARAEVEAFAARLNQIIAAGGRIKEVQIYTLARTPGSASTEVLTALSVETLRQMADWVGHQTQLPVHVFGPSDSQG